MHAARVRSSALISAAVLLGAMALGSYAWAQTPAQPASPPPAAAAPAAAPTPTPTPAPAAPTGGVVQRIVIRGAERIEDSTILSYLPIAPGDRVDSARIDDALKTLFKTDLFADVQIQLQGTDLIVRVS